MTRGLASLEFHARHSRMRRGADAAKAGGDFASSTAALEASVLERPDYVLFDLDPLPGAPVSMPVTWRELAAIDPLDFRLPTVLPRLRKRGDAWAGWLDSVQSVEEALTRAIDSSESANREQRR